MMICSLRCEVSAGVNRLAEQETPSQMGHEARWLEEDKVKGEVEKTHLTAPG
jgi:hypothetical protein